MKVRVESSHKALGSLLDHAARGFAGDFLAKLTDAGGCCGSDGLDLGDDT